MQTIQSNHSTDSQSRAPGRLYTFIVLGLATVVIGISVDAVRALPSDRVPEPTTVEESTLTKPVTKETRTTLASVTAEREKERDATAPPTGVLSNFRLLTLFGFAALVGIISTIPSREPLPDPSLAPKTTAESIAQSVNLPLLGSVLQGKPVKPKAQNRAPGKHWMTTLLFAGEMILCVSVLVAIFGCLTGDTISSQFLQNPFEAYVQSVQHVVKSVTGLLAEGPATA